MTLRLLLVSLALFPFALGQQPPQPAPAQPPPQGQQKMAVLEGKVTDQKTGEPVRRATITLRPMGGAGMGVGIPGPGTQAAPYNATTDAEGKFRIEQVEAGNYGLIAERQGYVRQGYGGRGRLMSGITIKVAPGQELTNLDMELVPQGVITGRVLDDIGEPLARVQIQVLERRYWQGKEQLMVRSAGATLDTGEFRIAELPPGRYWISATYRGPGMMRFGQAPRNVGEKPEEDYVSTYYPDSIDHAGATAVNIAAGQTLSGIDIRMRKARVYRIRGKVTGMSPPFHNIRLAVAPRERSLMALGTIGPALGVVKNDGSFELAKIQPGSYYVTVLPFQGSNGLGKVAVDVGQEDVDDVVLQLSPGASLSGQIKIDGDVQPLEQALGHKVSFAGVRIQMAPMEGIPMSPPGTNAKDDGSFVLENVGPDKFQVMVMNLPQGTWLKSVRLGDREVLDHGLDTNGGVAGPLEIELGVGVGQIAGIVQNEEQLAAPGALVTLLPDPMKQDRSDLYRITTADQNGQFVLQNVRPGEYKLYAWEDIDSGAYLDPELLKAHEGKAQKIRIKENTQQQVTLRQAPAEATKRP